MKTLTLLLLKLLVFTSLIVAQPSKPVSDPRIMRWPTGKSVDHAGPISLTWMSGSALDHNTAVSLGYGAFIPITDAQSWYRLSPLESKVPPPASSQNVWIDLNQTRYMLPVGKVSSDNATIFGIVEHLVDQHANSLGTTSLSGQVRLDAIITDDLGFQHVKINQTVDGRDVWGSQIVVHADFKGQVYAIQGSAERIEKSASWNSSFTFESVVDHVLDMLRIEGTYEKMPAVYRNWLYRPDPQLMEIWYPNVDGELIPAYEIEIHPNGTEWLHLFVDAQTGAILNQFSKVCLDPHAEKTGHVSSPRKSGASQPNPAGINLFGGTFGNVTAVDLKGQTVPIRTYRDPAGPYFMLWDTPSLDVAKSEQEKQILGGIITITHNFKDWGTEGAKEVVSSTDNTWNDSYAVSAHNNLHTAYRYYLDTFNRNSFDDKGATIRGIVHITHEGKPMLNAFWFNGVMGFGDAGFNPMPASLDVIGHEFNHAVVEYTAGLVYQFQSGALNESYSDLFGNIIQNDPSMLIGEDVIDPNMGEAMRNMINPGSPNLEGYRRQPSHMNEYINMASSEDNGGVHVNSGIPNRAAALVANAIGFEKAGKIYYRAMTNYLTRNSQFIDSRRALVQSAIDLYGSTSQEVSVIRQAHDTVGVLETDGNNPNPDPRPDVPPPVPPITGEKSLVAFMGDDGKIGLLDMTNPLNISAGFIQHPGAVARVSQQGTDRSQLSAPVNGKQLYFVNQNNRLAYVDLTDMQVYEFPNVFIQTPGDIWNASINPEGTLVALVSAYTNDATLYFTNGTEVVDLPIKPETTGQGLKLSTVLYPDVISWSPDPSKPKLAFDALNRISLKSGDYDFWSVFEVDLVAGTMFNMIPGQPVDISIGNVTYSKLHPNIVAFNTMQNHTGVLDINLVDFGHNSMAALGLPNVLYNDSRLDDAQRPTFSPDNKYVAFSSAKFGSLFFLHLESSALTPVSLGIPVYNPYWLMYGGQYTTSDEDGGVNVPVDFKLYDAYPNPFNPATTIDFEIPSATMVRYDLYDLVGRRVRTVVNQHFQAGRHSFRLDASHMPSGVYIGRMTASGSIKTHKITLIK